MCNAHHQWAWLLAILASLAILYSSRAISAEAKIIKDGKSSSSQQRLLVVTVATEGKNDALRRFVRSAKIYGLNTRVLGLVDDTRPAGVIGGGYKVRKLKEFLEPYKKDAKLLVLYVDGYNSILNGNASEILRRINMRTDDARVIFEAESTCLPESVPVERYPHVHGPYRCINGNAFIGYAPSLYKLTTALPIKDTDDDQAYYVKLFIDVQYRIDMKMKIDYECQTFQQLRGADGEYKIEPSPYVAGDAVVVNDLFKSHPVVIHLSGPQKETLNSFGNYIARTFTNNTCVTCKEDDVIIKNLISKDNKRPEKKFPNVMIGIFLNGATPFIDNFFNNIFGLNYPKERIDIRVNSVQYHDLHVKNFLAQARVLKYKSVRMLYDEYEVAGAAGADVRARMMAECKTLKCDFYLTMDGAARLTNPDALVLLVAQNRSILAPKLTRSNEVFSNFWGAFTDNGYYKRSHDYLDIVYGNKRGLWNVPYIMTSYMIRGDYIHGKNARPEINWSGHDDFEIAFCSNLRKISYFMFVINDVDYGHLVNFDGYDTNHVAPDLFNIEQNSAEWEQKYLHPDYKKNVIASSSEIQMPCTDVYRFPLVSDQYCTDMIHVVEKFGKWSNGANEDARLSGGYENVPTRDIHMNQVGYEKQWLFFLKEYVQPVQRKVYIGYHHNPPRSNMNFIVRYKPDEQPFLEPHHDASTYTINIALNQRLVDFEGGGCRFMRYNCSVTDTKKGWTIMHPGRLTHQHEGLYTTKGTRYIQIAFIDP